MSADQAGRVQSPQPEDDGWTQGCRDDGERRKWAARPNFALDADLTVYWPDVRPCWEAA